MNKTMEAAEFEILLKRLENETIDFKAENYVFGGSGEEQKERKAKFLKDVICMWNTPREEPAHIILGVKKCADGSYDLIGIKDVIDDAVFQQQFQDSVYPMPTIEVIPVNYADKKFTVIKIPLDKSKGPILSRKTFGDILRNHQVYYRQASRNTIADQQAQHKIFDWFKPGSRALPATSTGTEWETFISFVNNFDPSYKYILIVHRMVNISERDLSALGLVDWILVIDFDSSSESDGLLSVCKDEIKQHRSLHLVVKGDRPNINPRAATYWYFANGLVGRESTLVKGGKWIDWNTAYKRDIDQLLENFAKASNPSPVCCITIWNDETKNRFLDSVLSSVTSVLGDAVSNIILSPQSECFETLKENYNASVVSIPFAHLCGGLRSTKITSQAATIPSSSGVPLEIPRDKLTWLQEELEIVTLDTGQICPEGRQPGRDFLRGNEISWFDLGLGYDVERDRTSKLESRVREALNARRPSRINLYHAPGAGGTTIARRILWNLHRQYPCVLIQSSAPEETVERLSYLL
jgi:hypothetical protein